MNLGNLLLSIKVLLPATMNQTTNELDDLINAIAAFLYDLEQTEQLKLRKTIRLFTQFVKWYQRPRALLSHSGPSRLARLSSLRLARMEQPSWIDALNVLPLDSQQREDRLKLDMLSHDSMLNLLCTVRHFSLLRKERITSLLDHLQLGYRQLPLTESMSLDHLIIEAHEPLSYLFGPQPVVVQFPDWNQSWSDVFDEDQTNMLLQSILVKGTSVLISYPTLDVSPNLNRWLSLIATSVNSIVQTIQQQSNNNRAFLFVGKGLGAIVALFAKQQLQSDVSESVTILLHSPMISLIESLVEYCQSLILDMPKTLSREGHRQRKNRAFGNSLNEQSLSPGQYMQLVVRAMQQAKEYGPLIEQEWKQNMAPNYISIPYTHRYHSECLSVCLPVTTVLDLPEAQRYAFTASERNCNASGDFSFSSDPLFATDSKLAVATMPPLPELGSLAEQASDMNSQMTWIDRWTPTTLNMVLSRRYPTKQVQYVAQCSESKHATNLHAWSYTVQAVDTIQFNMAWFYNERVLCCRADQLLLLIATRLMMRKWDKDLRKEMIASLDTLPHPILHKDARQVETFREKQLQFANASARLPPLLDALNQDMQETLDVSLMASMKQDVQLGNHQVTTKLRPDHEYLLLLLVVIKSLRWYIDSAPSEWWFRLGHRKRRYTTRRLLSQLQDKESVVAQRVLHLMLRACTDCNHEQVKLVTAGFQTVTSK